MVFRNIILGGAALLAAAGAAHAAGVTLNARVMQEKLVEVDGRKTVKLLPATRVTPGDAVIYQLTYNNGGTKVAEQVVLTNPLPDMLEYVAADGATVSVDGARNFGALGSLRVALANGTSRAATARDVTHLRWTLASIAPGASGQVSFRARLK